MFACECGREFKSKNALIAHARWCDKYVKKSRKTVTPVQEGVVYKCECGREFPTQKSLSSHARFCDKYVKKPKKVSPYKQENGTYKCECGKIFNNHQALNGHLSYCDIHHAYKGTERKLRKHEDKHIMSGWENKTPEEIQAIYDRARATHSLLAKEGKIKTTKGTHLTEEHKQKIREGFARNFSAAGCRPNYNPKQIEYIDKLNKDNNWNLQHAENGGEKYVCGYFVDGYDEKKNIVFEYDEKKHYLAPDRTQLREKDIQRQNKIIENLGCDFYRYNEYLDYFYKVN